MAGVILGRLTGFFTPMTHFLSDFDDFWHADRTCNQLSACQKSSKSDKKCVIGVKNKNRGHFGTTARVLSSLVQTLVAAPTTKLSNLSNGTRYEQCRTLVAAPATNIVQP